MKIYTAFGSVTEVPNLIFLFCATIRPKIRVLIDFFFLCTRNHSTEIYGSLSFILSLIKNIRPKIRVLTYSFLFLYTTIWLNYMVLFHLFLLLRTTIRPTIKVHNDLFLYIHITIGSKVRVPINVLTLFVHDHSTKN